MNQQRRPCFIDHDRAEVEFVAVKKHFDQRSLAELTLNQGFGKRIFDIFLQRAAQRASAVRAIGAGLVNNPALRFVRQLTSKPCLVIVWLI